MNSILFLPFKIFDITQGIRPIIAESIVYPKKYAPTGKAVAPIRSAPAPTTIPQIDPQTKEVIMIGKFPRLNRIEGIPPSGI